MNDTATLKGSTSCVAGQIGRQVRPPSAVVKRRPSAVVTVAVLASVALTAVKSTASWNVTRCQRRPSVESRTVPARPTSQQTDADGEAPAVRSAETPVASGCQVAPPSLEYS